jgi:glutamine amidotransferase
MIGIINYDAGNIASITNALNRIGSKTAILDSPADAINFSHYILPGVGSFNLAMKELNKRKWDSFIREEVSKGKFLMGICLGMQLFFEKGTEGGDTEGLGIMKGTVRRLDVDKNLPHTGWNSIEIVSKHPVFSGIKSEIDYYFVHSFHCIPTEKKDVIATCNYGHDFVAVAANQTCIGVQFHPEKSQPSGLKLLENFSNWH